ncbi:hypothetical protein [Parabacteroides sp. FAFU027]|uniref:hypothetical protein n=1 Tax=Parabacteroides sp. FAFU027 TaxID=2922715 RepID=UPI001FAF19D6|nr:hypothetical protein [Parabacteroides sp. FAFU027]
MRRTNLLNKGNFISLKTGLTFLLLLFATKSHSGNTLISESCASSPTEWSYTNNNTNNPIQKEGYWLLDAGTPGDQIISPAFDTGNYTNLTLSFSYAGFDNGNYNSILVSYSTDGGASWSATNFLTATPTSNSTFTASGDLIIGTANTRNFKFRLSNPGSSGRGVKIKDILLTASPIITAPTSLEATCISLKSFNANWSAMQGATGYLLNVNKSTPAIDENFNTIAASSSFVTSGSGASGNLNLSNSGWSVINGYAAGGTVKLGTSSLAGTLISPALNLSGKFKITFKAAAWSGDSKTIDILLNGTALKTITLDNNISSASELKEFTISGVGTGVDTIRFSAPKTTSNRFFIDDVKICKLEAIEGSPFSVATGETCYKVSVSTSGIYSYTIQATNNIYTSEESNEVTVGVNSISEATTAKVNQTTLTLSKGAVTILNPTQNEKITIYKTNGAIVSQFTPTKTIHIPLPAGIYLIRSLNSTLKVVIE